MQTQGVKKLCLPLCAARSLQMDKKKVHGNKITSSCNMILSRSALNTLVLLQKRQACFAFWRAKCEMQGVTSARPEGQVKFKYLL